MINAKPNSRRDERQELAATLGLSAYHLTDSFIHKAKSDPLFLHHMMVCRGDQELIRLLLSEATEKRVGDDDANEAQISDVGLLLNATSAMVRWAANGFALASDDEISRRLRICESCEHMTERVPSSPLYTLVTWKLEQPKVCKLCGCEVSRKTKLASEKCPDSDYGEYGRWQPK